ncbi:phage tail protein [Arenimonas sp. MALMAid1274]|uniref:phage tail protein n=1 Tax=Arenimonas sp. MALMAid1274 TaxID=3411630 RepID=UPI003B9ED427
MSEHFLAQIMMVGFTFAPKGFALCNGQLLPIAQNQALFSLLGTQFGGNGVTNFALPDLRSRTPLGAVSSTDAVWQPVPPTIGERGGTENVTLLTTQIPSHTHSVAASTVAGTTRNPSNAIFGSTGEALHAAPGGLVPLANNTIGFGGGSQPHPNLQPYTAINFCIALTGIFPSRN